MSRYKKFWKESKMLKMVCILQGISFGQVLLLLSFFSRVRLWATLWTAAHQAPPSTGFSRQEYWSMLPFPSPFGQVGSKKGTTHVVVWSLSCVWLCNPMQTKWKTVHKTTLQLCLSLENCNSKRSFLLFFYNVVMLIFTLNSLNYPLYKEMFRII